MKLCYGWIISHDGEKSGKVYFTEYYHTATLAYSKRKGGNPRRSGNYGKVRGLGGWGQNTTFKGVLDHVNYDKKNNDNSDLNFLRVTLWCIIIIKLAALKFLVMW